MRKRKRRWPRAAGKRLVSFAAVGLATAALMGMLPRWEKNGLFVETASALSEEDGVVSELPESEDDSPAPEQDSPDPEVAALLDEWQGILFDFARVSRMDTAEQKAFVKELMIRLEALSWYDLEGFAEKDRIYALYAKAAAAQDVLDRADAFDASSTLMCSVFAELARIKKGGVFTRGGEVEFAQNVLQAVEETESFLSRDEAACLEGTLFELNRAELFAQARAAAGFLIARMDTLADQVTEDQYIVYRYALGGGWEENLAPQWLVTDSLYRLAEMVRDSALEKLYAEGLSS